MLDGLLGRGFSAKCKSLIKTTKARIEVVRRRAEAKQRFLKEDLAKLLANGLDINAFGRTEEFLAGANLLGSYDFIEQTCEYITGQLSCMQKQRECPEECREAVGSLMFAAARFSDLPELRDLRDVFQERYGNSLDCYVHQKFLEKLSSRPPEKERKIQLLQDIASEYSLKWDSRGFEQRMSTPSPIAQSQPNKHVNSHATANKYNLHTSNDSAPRTEKREFSAKEIIPELVNGSERTENGRGGTTFRREDITPKTDRRDTLINQRPDIVNGGEKIHYGREGNISRRKESASSDSHKPTSSSERSVPIGDKIQEVTVEKYKLRNEKDDSRVKAVRSVNSSDRKKLENVEMHGLNNLSKGEFRDGLSYEKSESTPSSRNISGKRPDLSTRHQEKQKLQEENVKMHGLNNLSKGEFRGDLSYEKSKATPSSRNISGKRPDLSAPHDQEKQKMQEEEAERLPYFKNSVLPPPYVKTKDSFLPPPYTKPRDSNHRSSKGSRHANSDHDGPSMEPLPHNIEMDRSKHERTSSEPAFVNAFGHEDVAFNQENMIPLPKPRSVRRKHHRSSSSHQNEVGSFEDVGSTRKSSSSRRRDHSKKSLPIGFDDERHKKDDEEKMIDKLLLHYSKKPSDYEIGKLTKGESSSHDRSREGRDGRKSDDKQPPIRSVSLPYEQSVPPADIKVYTRANSFQPDDQARHVHPKLPDYEDLAARFASLRGR